MFCILDRLHDVTYINNCPKLQWNGDCPNTCNAEYFCKVPLIRLGLELYLKKVSIESILKFSRLIL